MTVEILSKHLQLKLDNCCFGLLYLLSISIVHLYHGRPPILVELFIRLVSHVKVSSITMCHACIMAFRFDKLSADFQLMLESD